MCKFFFSNLLRCGEFALDSYLRQRGNNTAGAFLLLFS